MSIDNILPNLQKIICNFWTNVVHVVMAAARQRIVSDVITFLDLTDVHVSSTQVYMMTFDHKCVAAETWASCFIGTIWSGKIWVC